MNKWLTEKELEYLVNHLSELEDADDIEIGGNNAEAEENNCPDLPDLSESDNDEMASEGSDVQSVSDTDEPLQDLMIGRDGTQWFYDPPSDSCTRSHNIVISPKNKVVLPPGKILEDPVDAFFLYIDRDIIENIVNFTNLEANRVLQDQQNLKWKNCDKIEMYAFIGLLLTAGHLKQHYTNYVELWNSVYGPPIFRATMGMQRFKALLRFIRFDDKTTRSERRKKDKLAPFRDIWEKINRNLGKVYTPGVNLTVDEQLVPFRGRCPFRQYLPSKPDKYGMKIWWLCDSKTFYPLKGLPYLGKEGGDRAHGLAAHVVETLTEPYYFTNRNITCDNYFTDLNLALHLLSKGLTVVGTVRKNKSFIPPLFLANKNKEVNSFLFGFTKKTTLVSHVPKRNKCVILLSTMHHTASVDEERGNKPEINLYYNETKGGVDSLDQLTHEYMSKRKSNRWPFVYFCNSLDACGIAAYIIWTTTYPDWNKSKHDKRRMFLKSISESLVLPHIERRKKSAGLTSNIVKTTTAFQSAVLQTTSSSSQPQDLLGSHPTNKRKRCYICPAKKSRIQKQVCNKCCKNVCNEHSQSSRICDRCKK